MTKLIDSIPSNQYSRAQVLRAAVAEVYEPHAGKDWDEETMRPVIRKLLDRIKTVAGVVEVSYETHMIRVRYEDGLIMWASLGPIWQTPGPPKTLLHAVEEA